MRDRCGMWMERKRRAVPGEICANTHVHLEAVETAKDTQAETGRTWSCRALRGHDCLQSKRLLVPEWKQSGQLGLVKRKTDTLGILRPLQCVILSICSVTLFRLVSRSPQRSWCHRRPAECAGRDSFSERNSSERCRTHPMTPWKCYWQDTA